RSAAVRNRNMGQVDGRFGRFACSVVDSLSVEVIAQRKVLAASLYSAGAVRDLRAPAVVNKPAVGWFVVVGIEAAELVVDGLPEFLIFGGGVDGAHHRL